MRATLTISTWETANSSYTMSSSSIKLTYLNLKGRAELIRFILSYASHSFEDNRIEPGKWAEEMPGTEFGIPVLEFEGEILTNNKSIALYLADKYNIAGASEDEIKETNDVLDLTEETWNQISNIFWQKDQAKKADAMKELGEKHLPEVLTKLEGKAAKNNAERGWIVGNNVTYADFAISVLLDAVIQHKPGVLTVFTALAKLKESVEELPGIKEWIANRPDTSH